MRSVARQSSPPPGMSAMWNYRCRSRSADMTAFGEALPFASRGTGASRLRAQINFAIAAEPPRQASASDRPSSKIEVGPEVGPHQIEPDIFLIKSIHYRENLAVTEGFEPSVRLYTVQRFSKPPPSATRPRHPLDFDRLSPVPASPATTVRPGTEDRRSPTGRLLIDNRGARRNPTRRPARICSIPSGMVVAGPLCVSALNPGP